MLKYSYLLSVINNLSANYSYTYSVAIAIDAFVITLNNVFLHIGEDKTQYVSISSLLRYTTGLSSFPPLLNKSSTIKITYQLKEDSAYPKAQVCFSKLMLPVVHNSQKSFNEAFIKALELGGGYGNI